MSDEPNVRIRVHSADGQPLSAEELAELREAFDNLTPLTPELLREWLATEPDARDAMAYKAARAQDA